MINKIYLVLCVMVFMGPFSYTQHVYGDEKTEGHGSHAQDMRPVTKSEGEISHYTCGMHPSVRVSVENYNKGDTKCPICFMPLTPVKSGGTQAADFNENVISKVAVKLGELKLAGVQTETVQKRQLFKEIRVVGRVAYDPELAIAQDEFISGVKAYEKSKSGTVPEIMDRAKAMVDSSQRKLLLLGLSEEQIVELKKTKEVQTNLILPGEKMWIYGDVYEYELPWVKKGSYIKATPIGLIGEEFYGEVVSINPVIDPRTRSVRFRALIDNPGSRLKPEMYVDIQIMSQYTDPDGNDDVVAIPKSALLDTGRRRIVWVDTGNGQFEGRSIEIGPESVSHSNDFEKYYPVLKGVQKGEKVVTKGNFLIDSQSQITGVAATSYGGALDPGENKDPIHGSHEGH